jgi:hypothetical protein
MITDEELMQLIERVTEEFEGDLDEFNKAVGMLVVGRLLGWRVQRLVSPRSTWTLASKWFGDPKKLMPDRGPFSRKSVGLAIVDRLGDYWGIIRGSSSRAEVTAEQRRMVTSC